MLRILTALTLLALAAASFAGEISAQVHIGSEHFFDSDLHQNESNPGLGAVYSADSGAAYVAGTYFNTESRNTSYFGIGRHWTAWGGSHRLVFGGATGYKGHTVLPSMAWQYNPGPVVFTLSIGVVGYGLEYDF